MPAVYEQLIAQVPPLPPACRRVIAVASGDHGAAELTDAIALDPRMSMQLLRVANSSFLARVTPAHTVTDAVVTIGVGDAARIATGTAMLAELAPPHPLLPVEEVFDLGACVSSVWRPFGDHAATAGVLTNAGLLAMARAPEVFDTYVSQAASTADFAELHALEARLYGMDRCALNAEIGRAWELPEPIVEVLFAWHLCRMASGEKYLAFVDAAAGLTAPLLQTIAAR